MINNAANKNTCTRNKYDNSGIYKIQCNDCSSFYIGQTGRSFKSRFKEHIQALKSNNTTSMKSSYAEHLLQTNHSYTSMEVNMNILEIDRKGDSMNCKEDYHIYTNKISSADSLLNTTHTNVKNPIFEYINSI